MITYPLNDVEYLAEDAELYNCPRKSGVYAENSFEYALTGGNEITIGKGIAWIKNAEFAGKVVANKSSVALDAGIADAFHPRIDAVVIQFDAVANKTKLIIKKGVASVSPVPPEVVRSEDIYELHLYHIERLVGDAALYSGQITDLRMSEEYCGLMADAVTEIDTSAIFAQYMDMLNNFEEKVGEIVLEDLTAAKESGEFNPVKGVDYWTAEDKEEIIEEAVSRDFGSQGLAYTLNEDGASYSVVGIGECPDTDITIPSRHEGLPVIGISTGAFHKNAKITSVTLPKSIQKIGSAAFVQCSALSEVNFNEGLHGILSSAFRECSKLKRIHLYAGLAQISEQAFDTGEEIEVIFHGTAKQWNAIDLADGWATSYKLFVTYNGDMVGATDNFNGASGYVPAPSAGDQNSFLRGDGSWASVDVPSTIEKAKTAEKMASLNTATDNAYRSVWFSDSNEPTLPRKDNDFTYNPSKNTLKVKNVEGTASKAKYADEAGTSVKKVVGTEVHLSYGDMGGIGITLPDGKTVADIMHITISGFYLTGYGVDISPITNAGEFQFVCNVNNLSGGAETIMFIARLLDDGTGFLRIFVGRNNAAQRIIFKDGVSPKIELIAENDMALHSSPVVFTVYFK